MVKNVLNFYTLLAAVSPWVFLLARAMGVYNFGNDALIFICLFDSSIIVLFLWAVLMVLVDRQR